jgi:diguanylate cyclase
MNHVIRHVLLLLLCFGVSFSARSDEAFGEVAQPAWPKVLEMGAVSVIKTQHVINALELGSLVQRLPDRGRSLDLAAVLATPDAAWRAETGHVLKLGYEDSAWWLRFSIRNDSSLEKQLLLDVGWPLLDYLDVYILRDGETQTHWATGDQRPYASRPLDARTFVFPLAIPAGDTRQVFMRLDLRDGVYDLVPLTLWERAPFFAEKQAFNLIMGCYFGAVLALLTYALLLFVSTGERSLLYYTAYLGSFLLWIVGYLGYGNQYLWPDSRWWSNQYGAGTAVPVMMLATLFITHFLETKRRSPRLHWLMWTLALLGIIPMLAVVADSLQVTVWIEGFIYLHTVLLVSIMALYLFASLRVLRGGFKPARFFALGWTCMFLGILVYQLSQIPGLLPGNFFVDNSMIIGSVMEFLLLALAIGDRIKIQRDDKLAAERQLVELRSAHAEELELQVKEQTKELREALSKIETLACTDELTSLFNRRAFNEIFEREHRRAHREQTALALCMVDIDFFKSYNDRYGHQAGDEALRRFSACLAANLQRPSDYVFRLGGEEFAVLMTNRTGHDNCLEFVKRLRREIVNMNLFHLENPAVTMTASFGMVYCAPGGRLSTNDMVSDADAALYEAKRTGRNKVVSKTPAE